MPAYRQRIYLCPDEDSHPGWIMDFPLWWNQREFFREYGKRQIDTGNPFYVDYALLLTAGEASAWDKKCRQAFEREPESERVWILEAMHQLEIRLRSTSWVIVESYEWESGLD